MRRLADFEDPDLAHAFSDVLAAANVSSELRPGPERSASVWVLAEDELRRAQQLLREFMAQPNAPEYEQARAVAQRKREAAQQAELASRVKVIQVRKPFRQRVLASPATYGSIAICLLVALITQLGSETSVVSQLSFASFERSGGYVRWNGLRDLMNGELWRLFTPIFLHFGPFHLLFNAFWLKDLGEPTERFQGSLRFVGFLLWSAAVSNCAQMMFGGGPTFGGMSGIVYALVGYLWSRGRADPASGIHLPGQLVAFFVAWMLLGFTGLLDGAIGPMANYCHFGGFVAGALYGFVAARLRRA
jgi:GlpG protein